MDLNPRIESLTRRHAEIEALVQAEEGHPFHNEQHLHDLKVKRLRVKEELRQLKEVANSNLQQRSH